MGHIGLDQVRVDGLITTTASVISMRFLNPNMPHIQVIIDLDLPRKPTSPRNI